MIASDNQRPERKAEKGGTEIRLERSRRSLPKVGSTPPTSATEHPLSNHKSGGNANYDQPRILCQRGPSGPIVRYLKSIQRIFCRGTLTALRRRSTLADFHASPTSRHQTGIAAPRPRLPDIFPGGSGSLTLQVQVE